MVTCDVRAIVRAVEVRIVEEGAWLWVVIDTIESTSKSVLIDFGKLVGWEGSKETRSMR